MKEGIGISARDLVKNSIQIAGAAGVEFDADLIAELSGVKIGTVRTTLSKLGGLIEPTENKGSFVIVVDDGQEGPMWDVAGTGTGVHIRTKNSGINPNLDKTSSGSKHLRKKASYQSENH